MKCPYNNCRKDYNAEEWPPTRDGFINSANNIDEEMKLNRVYLVSRKCRFCGQLFHEISVGKVKWIKEPQKAWANHGPELEELITYPVSKTKFEARSAPAGVMSAFNEAERCRSVGSITGAGACLRKAVYVLCDEQGVNGSNYREKIGNLPVKTGHQELLKQFKWLGDNVIKPGEEKYSKEMVDAALDVLPIIIDGLYLQAEKEDETAKLLAKARAANPEA